MVVKICVMFMYFLFYDNYFKSIKIIMLSLILMAFHYIYNIFE